MRVATKESIALNSLGILSLSFIVTCWMFAPHSSRSMLFLEQVQVRIGIPGCFLMKE